MGNSENTKKIQLGQFMSLKVNKEISCNEFSFRFNNSISFFGVTHRARNSERNVWNLTSKLLYEIVIIMPLKQMIKTQFTLILLL